MNKTIHLLITSFGFITSSALLVFTSQAILFVLISLNSLPPKSICLVAGRSGGHIIPARTFASQYKKNNPQGKTLFFSTNTPLDIQLLSDREEIDKHIPCKLGNIPRYNYLQLGMYIIKSLILSGRAYSQIIRNNIKNTTTTGGYIALPISAASWMASVPIFLYELNATPGGAAHLLHILAKETRCPFACAQKHFLFPQKTSLAPYPVRFTFEDKPNKLAARNYLKIKPNKLIITIIGGSQGSHFFNTKIPHALAKLNKKSDLFVIQQTGIQDQEIVKKTYQNLNIEADVFSFRSDINYLYAAADLCISRAGAGSIFELLFFQTPTIIIPLETSITDHQLDNAKALTKEHPDLFSLLRQKNIKNNPTALIEMITNHLKKTNFQQN